MPEPLPQLDYRLALLAAAQRELWRLQQQFTDEHRRRQLTEAALEALECAKRFDTSINR